MEGFNFKQDFLKNMFFWFQKLITLSFFKIGISNFVVIPFDTFRKNVMIQNFYFIPKFWEKKFWKKKLKFFLIFSKFFFQIFFSQNLDKKSKFWIITFFLNVSKSITTKFEIPILKNGQVISFWNQSPIFQRKTRLKLDPSMRLGANSKTELAITLDTVDTIWLKQYSGYNFYIL